MSFTCKNYNVDAVYQVIPKVSEHKILFEKLEKFQLDVELKLSESTH